MNKHMCLLTLFGTCTLALLSTASPVFASTKQISRSYNTTAIAQISVAQSAPNVLSLDANEHFKPYRWYEHHAWYRGWRIHHQISCGTGDSHLYQFYQGTNQGNTGNQGDNEGFVQANDTNNGNQVIHQGINEGFERTFQFSCGFNDSGNVTYGIGNNIANGGNQGYNGGYLQDDSGNNGNQVIG